MVDDLTAPGEGTPSSGLDGAPESGAEEKDWRAENTRLRQKLAHQQDLLGRTEPLVKTVVALQKADGGKEILERLQKGEPLTLAQQKKVGEAEKAPITKEEVKEIVQEGGRELEQRMYEGRKAEQDMAALYEKAEQELPGLDKLKDTKEWSDSFTTVLGLIQNGALKVPVEAEDPYYWAVERAYKTLVAGNPEIGKKKPAAQSAKERAASILAGGRQSPASKTEEEEVPAELAAVRSLGSRTTVGRSFSNPASTRPKK